MVNQSKKSVDTSSSIDSQATVGQDSIDNPNANLYDSTSNATYDIASQIIYSSMDTLENTAENTADVTNEEPVVDTENDAEAMPADSNSAKLHTSLALNSEQIGDNTPADSDSSMDNAYNDATNQDIISDVENNVTDSPIENLDGDSDQVIITADVADETAVVNEEPDFYISSGSMCTHDSISFDNFIIASDNYMVKLDTSLVLDVEQNDMPIDIEDTVNNPSADNSLTGYVNFSELCIDDYTVPVDFIPIEETVTEEPFIIDDESYYEEFINDEYNFDEIVNGNSDQIHDPVTDEDFISIDIVEADSEVTEEAADELIDDSLEEPIKDYETPNDVIVDEGSYIPDESIDNNTDRLAETTDVTDESFITYSYASCWTTYYSLTLENYNISAMEVSLINTFWTADDTPIDTQTEVTSDDISIIPIGFPVSADWFA